MVWLILAGAATTVDGVKAVHAGVGERRCVDRREATITARHIAVWRQHQRCLHSSCSHFERGLRRVTATIITARSFAVVRGA